ncbi:AMP-binding protein [Myxococcus faecalis]|uniref:AMP-binding protein n=1 Tax=Myxococcus faecalis TaxID=3115646 RepID=UPI003CE8B270
MSQVRNEETPMDSIDVRRMLPRLLEHPSREVITFEKGKVVRRSHAQVHEDVVTTRAALERWGIRPGMRVGIRAPNCYEWLVHDLALLELRAVTVAFPDDFAARPPDELLERYQLSLLLVPGRQREGHTNAALAALDGPNDGVRAIERGTEPPPESFDQPWLVFSSGSSGWLKGLVLNRRGVEESLDAFVRAARTRSDDSMLLFLPISNFQQRLMYYAAFWYGFDLIVTEPVHLFRAMKELRPTALVAPPTLYEAIETRFGNLPRSKQLLARVLGGIARRLPSRSARDAMARRIFREVHETLGGRMRFMVTGMAPTKRSTLELLELMRLPVFETYGVTECGSVSLNTAEAHRLGSVGRLLPGPKVELAPDGEIIVHREHMYATGYFECADGENEKTFIGGNRVATGDVGRFDAEGYLYLVGRKKEIIITSGGEKVHPELVEAEIDRCPEVAKSVVFGGGTLTCLVAVVLPKNPDDVEAKRRIERHVEEVGGQRQSLRVGRVVFAQEAFTRENGLLRPNLKLDRKRIGDVFQTQLDRAAS